MFHIDRSRRSCIYSKVMVHRFLSGESQVQLALVSHRCLTCDVFVSAVTLISGIIIVLLFISEVRDFMAVEQDEELLVDTTRGEKLKINVDVIFHNIGCNCKLCGSRSQETIRVANEY